MTEVGIDDLKDWLNSREFYELCQTYRTTPVTDPYKVLKAFNDIQWSILDRVRRAHDSTPSSQ